MATKKKTTAKTTAKKTATKKVVKKDTKKKTTAKKKQQFLSLKSIKSGSLKRDFRSFLFVKKYLQNKFWCLEFLILKKIST